MNRVSIVSDNGLSSIRRQAIIITNARLVLIEPLGQSSEILLKIKKMHSRKYIWNNHLWNGGHFVQGEMS